MTYFSFPKWWLLLLCVIRFFLLSTTHSCWMTEEKIYMRECRVLIWGNAECLCSCQLQVIGGSFLKGYIEMISEHLSAPSWKENYDWFMMSTMLCVLVYIHSLFLTEIFHTYYNHAGSIITISSLILGHILIFQLVIESRYIL